MGLYFPLVQALATLAGALVLFAAATDVRHGLLTAGSLIAYLLYIDMLFSPVQQISQVFDGYQQAAVGCAGSGNCCTPDLHPAGRPPAALAARPGPHRVAGHALRLRGNRPAGPGRGQPDR